MGYLCAMPILVFLGLSVLELGPMYVTRRQTSDRRQTKVSLTASTVWGRWHKSCIQVILQYLNRLPFDADFDIKQYLFLTNYSSGNGVLYELFHMFGCHQLKEI